MPHHLVLFDVDGTLVDARGAGRRALERAFAHLDGRERALEGFALAGATDLSVLAAVRGVPAPEPDPRFEEHYLAFLDEELLATPPRTLPGVVELLTVLAEQATVSFGLATGNLREGARRKLSGAGLWPRFSFGGFGDRALHRRVMLEEALAAGRRHVGETSGAVVVGDTKDDVHAAHALGLPCLAVATGSCSADDLRTAGATWVVSDLTAPEVLPILVHRSRQGTPNSPPDAPPP